MSTLDQLNRLHNDLTTLRNQLSRITYGDHLPGLDTVKPAAGRETAAALVHTDKALGLVREHVRELSTQALRRNQRKAPNTAPCVPRPNTPYPWRRVPIPGKRSPGGRCCGRDFHSVILNLFQSIPGESPR